MNTSLRYSIYHSFLRVSVLVFALLLVFDSGLVSDQSKILSISTQQYLANAVSVQVGVTPTEVNQLTARITELEGDLAAKERLIAINLSENTSATMDKSTLILSVIVFILLVLILLNYILDFIRMRKMSVLQTS
ncbi:MAG: hypothetical protein KBC78_00545 [Candidatus Pacebacteria bacterium]|nr:hypothetical protein [Candidatus Paceibacterota bacterium]